jgi:large subunit ribosomal protein L18
MAQKKDRRAVRERIHRRVRRRVSGTAVRPRLVVFRSLNHVYAQLVDDTQGITLASASTVESGVREGLKHSGNKAAGRAIGTLIAARAQEKGLIAVVFDRAGFRYHGVVQELADAARKAGLKF